jgi:nucleotide-binding universal stress UspA family protein
VRDVAWHQLTEAAKGAALLVVGHRGRGAIASAMLGSVGLQALMHAHCPVTIVRNEVG